MSFRLKPEDRTVETAVRRIAVDRIDAAITAIDDPDVPRDKAVHTVRKRCKEMRALVRLVGPSFANSKKENRAFRDIARGLSGQRDADVMAATFEDLVSSGAEGLDPEAVSAVREALAEEAAPSSEENPEEAVRIAREALAAARLRALGWTIDSKGWRAIGGGLETTYRKARKGMSEAFASEDPALMHEWRKDAKYHANQLKVIRPLWPDVLKPTQKVADRLQEDLGDHHDLDVLANFLSRRIERFGGEAAMGPLLALCRTRQERLALSARSAGDRLFAEKPKAFTQRIRAYWSAWRRESRRTEESAPQKSASLIAEPEAV